MIANSEIIEVVAAKVREHRLPNLVVDPVMVAKSGDRLLRPEAVAALRELLIPLARVVTPNLPEASVLVGWTVASDEEMRRAAEQIVALGAQSVVVKGGHRSGPPTDLFFDGTTFRAFSAERIATRNTHGTGCTFASAIAAFLARGLPLEEAVGAAKRYLTEALRHASPLGHGHGPVHHFWQWWS
jgi:hydroxymethylpyrimidine/phosphomethylpyrimidine kinase